MSIRDEDLRWTRDLVNEGNETVTSRENQSSAYQQEHVIDLMNRDPLTGSLHFSEILKLMKLLDMWEEPTFQAHASNEITSISAVLCFRKALLLLEQKYPFSRDFGAADKREACIESSQKLYLHLVKNMPDPTLRFETLAMLSVDSKGQINQQKAKDIIKLFRPDREGNLTMIDFIKSIDSVYKEFRMLQATIDNASRIDRSILDECNVM